MHTHDTHTHVSLGNLQNANSYIHTYRDMIIISKNTQNNTKATKIIIIILKFYKII